ncbi:MAG TPA: cyclic nucleotide-binding domain-containing protein [Solirubrobacteraceae bacterium]
MGGARGATQAHYEAGETVFKEGDAGNSLLMILSGQVEMIKRVGSGLQRIRTLGPGEYFGEMALLEANNLRPPRGRRPR